MYKHEEDVGRAFPTLPTVAVRVSQPGPLSVLCSPMSGGRFGQRGQQKCPSIDAEDGNTERGVCHLMEMRVMIWDAASVSTSEHASPLPQP